MVDIPLDLVDSFLPIGLAEDVEIEVSGENEKLGKWSVKTKSTTVLMALSLFMFFVAYIVAMYMDKATWEIGSIIGGITSIGALFMAKKAQRNGGE